MSWTPSEIEGWELVGGGLDYVDQYVVEFIEPMVRIYETMNRLVAEGVDCDDDDWVGIVDGIDGMRTEYLGISYWGHALHDVLDHFPDVEVHKETVVGAGPGLSWTGIGIYVRNGCFDEVVAMIDDVSRRFQRWADQALNG